jgi:hypothetical protein
MNLLYKTTGVPRYSNLAYNDKFTIAIKSGGLY